MPCELIHDTLTIEIGILEASFGAEWRCYPLPSLQLTGQTDTVEFRTIVLSNEYLEATFCLDLGGRLIRLFDKRSGAAAVELPRTLVPVEDEFRGARLDAGVEFAAIQNGLAPVFFDEIEPESESDPVELRLFSINPWNGTDAGIRVRLSPGEPFLTVEACVNNREVRPTSLEAGVRFFGASMRHSSDQVALISNGRGIAIEFEEGTFDAVEPGLVSHRTELAGISRDRFVYRIHPISTLGNSPLMQSGIQCGVRDSEFRWMSASDLGSAKVLAGLADSRTVESQISLRSSEVGAINLEGLGSTVVRVVIRSESGAILLEGDLTERPAEAKELRPNPMGPLPDQAVWLTRESSNRAAAHFCLSREKAVSEDWQLADFHLEDALNYAGDHPLIWWAKAAVRRQVAEGDEERPEVMNAHFISPLEPLLRAEAFLANSVVSAEPSPLMSVIAADPMIALEVVCRYASAGFTRDAIRLLDELARHKSVPLLGYVHAYLMSNQGKMDVDVAQVVNQFEATPIEPPYPYRELEIFAAKHLAEKFVNSERLQKLTKILRDRMGE